MTFQKKKNHTHEKEQEAPKEQTGGLAARVDALEKELAQLKQEFTDHKQNLTDSGIRLIR